MRRGEEVVSKADQLASDIYGMCLTIADDVDARDRIITELLAMLKPDKYRPSWEYDEYARACEIAGRTE